MSRNIVQIYLLLAVVFGGSLSSARALEIDLVVSATQSPAAKAFIDRFSADDGIKTIGATAKVVPPAGGQNLRDEIKGTRLRLVLVPLTTLIQSGLVGNTPLVSALSEPGQFPDTGDLFDVQDSAMGQAVLAEVGRNPDIVPVAFWSRGQTAVVSARPIRTAADFRGRSLRPAIVDSTATIAALGSRAIQMSIAEAPSALRAGLFDTAEFETSFVTQVVDMGTSVNSVMTNFRPLIGVVIAGANAWNELTERQKAAIARALNAADGDARKAARQSETELQSRVNAGGFTVVNAALSDATGFQQASSQAFQRTFGETSVQYLQATRAARDNVVKLRSAPPPPASPRKAGTIRGPVLFVTSRDDAGGDPADRFGSKRHLQHRLTCGRIDYKADPDRHMGEAFSAPFSIGPVKLPDGEAACVKFVAAAAKENGKSRVLFYIHGFRNSFEDAVRRAIALSNDIEFDGVVLVWSWPAEKWAYLYLRDNDAARGSHVFAADFANALLDQPEIKRFDLLAHSMGTQIALPVVLSLRKRPQQPAIGALILAAPDESQFNVSQMTNAMPGGLTSSRTLYAAEQDIALKTSAFLHGRERRAGQGGTDILIVSGLESVDATDAEWAHSGLFTIAHAYVFDVPTVVADMKALLSNGQTPQQRGLTRHPRGTSVYWSIP